MIYYSNVNSIELLKSKIEIETTILILDSNLFKIYENSLREFKKIIIPPSEKSKSWKVIDFILKQFIKLRVDRNYLLVGFGGGVVTDITGFVASIFMRGIRCAFLSTSLLGQVDACLGGKNAINFANKKNLIGTFNNPEFVIIAIDLLNSLPEIEITNGYGEIIKHALIKDENYFYEIKRKRKDFSYLVKKSNEIKSFFVENDFKDNGIRKILNFGHTFGHAIEIKENIPHGFAVSIGINIANKISEKLGFLNFNIKLEIENIFIDYNLPVSTKVSKKNLCDSILSDKKIVNGSVDIILLKDIGESFIYKMKIKELFEIIKKI